MPVPYLSLDPAGGIEAVNGAFLADFAWTREAILQVPFGQLLTPPSRAVFAQLLARLHEAPPAQQSRHDEDCELELQRGDGGTVTVVLHPRVERAASGAVAAGDAGSAEGPDGSRNGPGELAGGPAAVTAMATTVAAIYCVVRDVSAERRRLAQLEYLAQHDVLTGLPTRPLLMDRLQQAMAQAPRRGSCLAVLYLDLDGFKGVNDRFGHAQGDRLLAFLAEHMRYALREGDTLARIGGDEMVAVLIDLPHENAAWPLVERLLVTASRPFPVGRRRVAISASIGVTFYPQSRAVNAPTLLQQADQAMYHAKQRGKGRWEVFDPSRPPGGVAPAAH